MSVHLCNSLSSVVELSWCYMLWHHAAWCRWPHVWGDRLCATALNDKLHRMPGPCFYWLHPRPGRTVPLFTSMFPTQTGREWRITVRGNSGITAIFYLTQIIVTAILYLTQIIVTATFYLTQIIVTAILYLIKIIVTAIFYLTQNIRLNVVAVSGSKHGISGHKVSWSSLSWSSQSSLQP